MSEFLEETEMSYVVRKFAGEGVEFEGCWKSVNAFFGIFDTLTAAEVDKWWCEYDFDLNPDRAPNFAWEFWHRCGEFGLRYGETKNVLDGEGDWVVKIPSDAAMGKLDHCREEVELWQKAKDDGLERYFSEAIWLGEVCVYHDDGMATFPVYAQRRVGQDGDVDWDEIEEKRGSADETTSKVYDDACDFGTDEGLVGCWIDKCGLAIAQRIMDFIATYDINDIHDSNWGWRDGVPCVYDFSGYRT